MQTSKICPKCKTDKPITEYWQRKTRQGRQPASRCKPCSTQANRDWRKKKPDYEKRRYQASKLETRERHLVRKYGVDLAAYDQMLTKQNGKCAICSKLARQENYGVLHVDHCHKTGAVRGLLCRNCNHVLGLMNDNPDLVRAAANYLDTPLVPQIPEMIGRAILEATQ